MSDRILIIEDEADLVKTLTYNLGREGFQVTAATTGQEALAAVAASAPDIVLLDLQLPDMPGTEICRRFRADAKTKHVPIIMVTAKSDEIDRVVGFEVGADDYVTKPFSVRELLLRIRAVLRRARAAEPTADAPTPSGTPGTTNEHEVIEAGKIKLDVDGHRAWVEGEQVRLTALEFKLLQTFLERQGRVQTRDHLLNDVWGIEADITTRTVDTHVKRLRDKLGRAGIYIETIRGVGYRFQLDADGSSPE